MLKSALPFPTSRVSWQNRCFDCLGWLQYHPCPYGKLDGGEISTLDFTLQVANRVHLANLIRTIRKHPEVISIARMKG